MEAIKYIIGDITISVVILGMAGWLLVAVYQYFREYARKRDRIIKRETEKLRGLLRSFL